MSKSKTADIFEPWNKGKSQGQKTPFTIEQVRAIKTLLAADSAARDLALFSVALDTMLRGVDLLGLQVDDCTDDKGQVRAEFNVRQQKTAKPVLVALTPPSVAALQSWIKQAGLMQWQPVFVGLQGVRDKPISTRTLRRLGNHGAPRSAPV